MQYTSKNIKRIHKLLKRLTNASNINWVRFENIYAENGRGLLSIRLTFSTYRGEHLMITFAFSDESSKVKVLDKNAKTLLEKDFNEDFFYSINKVTTSELLASINGGIDKVQDYLLQMLREA